MRLPMPVISVVLVAAACGGTSPARPVLDQGDKTKLAFALDVAQCMRKDGYPTYPDPSGPNPSDQGSGTRFDGTGIDVKSARFQTAEAACEHRVRRSLGLQG